MFTEGWILREIAFTFLACFSRFSRKVVTSISTQFSLRHISLSCQPTQVLRKNSLCCQLYTDLKANYWFRQGKTNLFEDRRDQPHSLTEGNLVLAKIGFDSACQLLLLLSGEDYYCLISINVYNRYLFLCMLNLTDNPLVCDCDLQWYRTWLKNLKDKDEDILQKKRTVCMMQHEHREYHLMDLPLDKMKCVIKAHEGIYSSASSLQAMMMLLIVCKLVILFH